MRNENDKEMEEEEEEEENKEERQHCCLIILIEKKRNAMRMMSDTHREVYQHNFAVLSHLSSLSTLRLPPTPAVITPAITPPMSFSILIFCGINLPNVSKSKPPPSPISYESNSCHSLISGQNRLDFVLRCHGIDGSQRSSTENVVRAKQWTCRNSYRNLLVLHVFVLRMQLNQDEKCHVFDEEIHWM